MVVGKSCGGVISTKCGKITRVAGYFARHIRDSYMRTSMRQANSLEPTKKKLLIGHSHRFKVRPVALYVFIRSRRDFFIFSLYICTSTMIGLTADSSLHLKLTTNNLCFLYYAAYVVT